jgi:hypothetical protein
VFVQRVVFEPKPGKIDALRDILLAASTAAAPVSIARRLFGPTQMLVLNRQHADMAAYQKWVESFTPNPAVADACTSIQTEFWEVTTPFPGPVTAARFTVRSTWHAANGPALVQLLKEVTQQTERLNATGGCACLQHAVYGETLAIARVSLFPSLAEVEKDRASRVITRSDETQAFAERIKPLMAAPLHSDLYQLLNAPAAPRTEQIAVSAARA